MDELAEKIKINKKACACAISLELLGDKWTILIIGDLFRQDSFHRICISHRRG